MKGKKAKTSRIHDEPIPNPLVVDEGEFRKVVRGMLQAEPTTLEGIKAERRKNPETDPRYLPVFPAVEKPKH